MNKKILAISLLVLVIVAGFATAASSRPAAPVGAKGLTDYEQLKEVGYIPLGNGYFIATFAIRANLGYEDNEYVNIFVDKGQNGFDNTDYVGGCSLFITDPAEGTAANPVMYSCYVPAIPGDLTQNKNYKVKAILSFGTDTGNNPRINPAYGNAVTRMVHILP
jgi:hypothetical protein